VENHVDIAYYENELAVAAVESRTQHWLFVVDLEKAAAILDGMKSEVIGPVRPGGLDATRALS
jgi:hypothetical protein